MPFNGTLTKALSWPPEKRARTTWTAGPCSRIPMPGGSWRNSRARPSATSPSMRWAAWKSEPFPWQQLYPIMPWRLNRRKTYRTFVVRKQAKDHGLGKRIEGAVKPQDRVLVVDDVLTSGGSVLQALQAAREANLHASHALVIVDRQEQNGKQKNRSARGVIDQSLDPGRFKSRPTRHLSHARPIADVEDSHRCPRRSTTRSK